jgi:hypothetical protein
VNDIFRPKQKNRPHDSESAEQTFSLLQYEIQRLLSRLRTIKDLDILWSSKLKGRRLPFELTSAKSQDDGLFLRWATIIQRFVDVAG